MFIREVTPQIILNSQNKKTIQITLKTYDGKFISSAPSGESKGKNEIPAYNEGGIEKSFRLLSYFCKKKLTHKNFRIKKIEDLKSLIAEIKRFESSYGKLGANVTYALETAFLKAGAKEKNKELWQLINDDVNKGIRPKMPMPVGNCIGGGVHSNHKQRKKPDFQEFLLIPREKTFSRAVTKNIHAHTYAKKLLNAKIVDHEGAWATEKTNEEVLEILEKVAKEYKIQIGVDIAASTFYNKGYYYYKNKELIRDKLDQVDYIEKLIKRFNIFYVEDPIQEEDFLSFREILGGIKKENKRTLIVGDDLTVTNMKFLRRAIESESINALIIKPNQIGSLVEVKHVVQLCKNHKITTIFSHRGEETIDDALADYAVGFGANYIKTGIYGKERLIKLKRVMDIEKSLR